MANNHSSAITVFLISVAFFMLAVTPIFAELKQFPNGFHNGGVGNCDECHSKKPQTTFKNTSTSISGRISTDQATVTSNKIMLNGSDPSSTCLLCHSAPAGQKQPSGFFISTSREDLAAGGLPPTQLTPGGDFGWLLKTYKWSSKGTSTNDELSSGDSHGHNIVAKDFGFNADINNALAPGGTYPADSLSCTSCHDPHGNYRRSTGGLISRSGMPIKSSGSYSTTAEPDSLNTVGTYRLLAGVGYQPNSLIGDFAFRADPPSAVSPSDYNRSETSTDTRVAYGMGMTEWCRNCHVTTHKNAHPMGNSAKLTSQVIRIYNSYLSSGKTNGSKDKAYNSLVPYEIGTDDYSVLKATANSIGSDRSGPKSGANVMCLTCHRAHASGWDHMVRWNERTNTIVSEGAFVSSDSKSIALSIAAQGRLSIETAKGLYERKSDSFGVHQGSLCSKCHQKD